jgi:predicted SnoaL-like aldol condensation-catalyzing enzyme
VAGPMTSSAKQSSSVPKIMDCFVALRAPRNDGSGSTEKFEGNKKESAMLRLLLAAALVTFAPAAFAADAQQMEANKKAVVEFYDLAINKKDFEAASKFLGPRYVQHNPRAADGPEGLKAFLAFLREKFPDYHSEIKRVFADGDYVIVHVHNVPTPGSRGNAIIDIFKLENGKVVEHWDVRQEIPEQSANSNI